MGKKPEVCLHIGPPSNTFNSLKTHLVPILARGRKLFAFFVLFGCSGNWKVLSLHFLGYLPYISFVFLILLWKTNVSSIFSSPFSVEWDFFFDIYFCCCNHTAQWLCALLFTYLRISSSNYKFFGTQFKYLKRYAIRHHRSSFIWPKLVQCKYTHAHKAYLFGLAWYPFPLARAPIHRTVSFHYRLPPLHSTPFTSSVNKMKFSEKKIHSKKFLAPTSCVLDKYMTWLLSNSNKSVLLQ